MLDVTTGFKAGRWRPKARADERSRATSGTKMLQFLRRRKKSGEPKRASVVLGAGEPPILRPPKMPLQGFEGDAEVAPESPRRPSIAPAPADHDPIEPTVDRERDHDRRPQLRLRKAPARATPPATGDAGLVAPGASPLDLPTFQLKIERTAPTFARVPDPVEGVYAALRAAFTPTQPKRLVRLFTGRRPQIERIVGAIERDRAHVVVFGDR